MMQHSIYRVESFEQVGPHALQITFNDGVSRVVNFEGILFGELFGPLRNPYEFARVKIDPEVITLVWPSGADFDPAILHDWPEHERSFRRAAEKWETPAEVRRRFLKVPCRAVWSRGSAYDDGSNAKADPMPPDGMDY